MCACVCVCVTSLQTVFTFSFVFSPVTPQTLESLFLPASALHVAPHATRGNVREVKTEFLYVVMLRLCSA